MRTTSRRYCKLLGIDRRLLRYSVFRLSFFWPQQVREFWYSEFEKYSTWLKSEATSPILNKVGQFLTSAQLRNILGQRENKLDLRKVIDEGKVLIVNLAKGKLGEDSSALFGAMMVTKIQLAAMSRADMYECERRPLYLFVDEAHNFLTLSFANVLSESRKYGLNLTLAHQYIEQFNEKIRAAVFGNVGTIIYSESGQKTPSTWPASFIRSFPRPTWSQPAPLSYIPQADDRRGIVEAFQRGYVPAPRDGESCGEKIIALSRERYGRPRAGVEKERLVGNILEVEREDGQGRLFLDRVFILTHGHTPM